MAINFYSKQIIQMKLPNSLRSFKQLKFYIHYAWLQYMERLLGVYEVGVNSKLAAECFALRLCVAACQIKIIPSNSAHQQKGGRVNYNNYFNNSTQPAP